MSKHIDRQRKIMQALIARESPATNEVQKYCDATDLDFDRLTLCYYVGGLCIQPAVPHSGRQIATKPKEQENRVENAPLDAPINQKWGGWGKDVVRPYLESEPDAGRLVCLDFDGRKKQYRMEDGEYIDPDGYKVKNKEDAEVIKPEKYPKISNVLEVCRLMKKRGIIPCVVEITTPDEGDEERAKLHVTFKCRRGERATTGEEHKERYLFLAEMVEEIVDGLDISDEERSTLELDDSMAQFSRLKRLAGHPKEGKDNCVKILKTDPDAYVAWSDVLETRRQEISLGTGQYVYGPRLRHEVWMTNDDGGIMEGVPDPKKSKTIARDVYPLGIQRDRDTGHRAVRVRLHDDMGRVHYEAVPYSAFADASSRNELVKELGNKAQILPGRAKSLATALDWWRLEKEDKTEVTSTQKQGWLTDDEGKRVYVHGDEVCGADWIVTGKAADLRAQKKGDLEGWQQGLRTLFNAASNVLWTAIGQSLGGCLIEPLGVSSYTLHLYGESTSGKTTALKVGAAIWGKPEKGEYIETWRTTSNRLEKTLQDRSGACLAIDELKELGSNQKAREQLRKVIMMITSGKGKGRLTSSIEARDDFRWGLTALSTGENSIRDWLGDLQQGGESVRALDLWVNPKSMDATISYDHALEVQRWCSENYGVAGPAFARYVYDHLDDVRRRYNQTSEWLRSVSWKTIGVPGAELARISDRVAIIATALDTAVEAEMIPIDVVKRAEAQIRKMEGTSCSIGRHVALCTMVRVIQDRGKIDTPEMRACQMIADGVASDPSKWPKKENYGSSYGEVYGVRESLSEKKTGALGLDAATHKEVLWICSSTLKASGIHRKAGVGPRKFLKWLCQNELATTTGSQSRLCGVKKTWYKVDLDKLSSLVE